MGDAMSENVDAAPIEPPFDIDIVVRADRSFTYEVRDPESPCDSRAEQFPHPDRCDTWGDTGAGGDFGPHEVCPPDCVDIISLGPEDAPSLALHIEGCGLTTDVGDIPLGPFPGTPPVDRVHGTPGSLLTMRWSSDQSDALAAYCITIDPGPHEPYDGARGCLDSEGQIELDCPLPNWAAAERLGSVAVFAVNGGQPLETAHGTVRIWFAGETVTRPVVYPTEIADGRWALPYLPTASMPTPPAVAVENGESNDLYATTFSYDPDINPLDHGAAIVALPSTSQFINQPGIEWVAGPATDEFERIDQDTGEVCSGTLPHVDLEVPFEIGTFAPTRLIFDLPTTTLSCDGGGTRELALAVDGDWGIVVSPEP